MQQVNVDVDTGFPLDFPYTWACDWGEDEQGVWVAFAVAGVGQAMRWIPPGSFMMGSPPDEPERYGGEVLHQVTLSRGFWLGETTVTQALWSVVMGDNPSRFKGAKLPVERVSWEDAQRFIQKLDVLQPGLALRLPTEAEWEYACRAGTRTPFSFGAQIDPSNVNYDGNYPYHGGLKVPYRAKTEAVKELPVNAWGLYQMHGNVWEWCSDWHDGYPDVPVLDPRGPNAGAERVLRGGSWANYGGVARAACRSWLEPGKRVGNIGFRLARSPGLK